MELGFKPGTVGTKVLELCLLAVGEKGRLGGHLQYSCLGNHMVRVA